MRSTALFVSTIIFFAAIGCSGFEREWSAWKSAPSLEISDASLIGLWEGSWISEASGHNGRLRCIVTPEGQDLETLAAIPPSAGSEGGYLARFRAKWSIFSFEHELHLEGTEEPTRFRGEADLGWPWGVYRYEGRHVASRLVFTYRTEKDHGTFELERVALGEGETAK